MRKRPFSIFRYNIGSSLRVWSALSQVIASQAKVYSILRYKL